jgi:ribosome-associated heat shock protein Hsp15
VADPGPGLRIDKFLWFARIAKTRAAARALAENGRIRIGGRRVERGHVPVRVGDVLVFALRGGVRVLRIEALPTRRGPPAEARALYADLELLTSEGGDD